MGGWEDFKQKKIEKSNKIFSVLERVYNRKWYIEKMKIFRKCERSIR